MVDPTFRDFLSRAQDALLALCRQGRIEEALPFIERLEDFSDEDPSLSGVGESPAHPKLCRRCVSRDAELSCAKEVYGSSNGNREPGKLIGALSLFEPATVAAAFRQGIDLSSNEE